MRLRPFDLIVCALLCSASSSAQSAVHRRLRLTAPSDSALLQSMRFRSIGPAGPGGRLDAIAVANSDPSTIYLGFATGGVFKSTDNTTTFEPVFESYGSASFGTLAIDPGNPNIVYAGTGENNNRQSSSFGDGLYKTVDGGKSWTNIGFRATQTISKIVIDPHDPRVLYVAAEGHLFGPNPERGLYKSTDAGATWRRVVYIDENTGFTDLAIDPANSRVLYAASYQRRRTGCCYNGGGPGSALWQSTDAGAHWQKLTGRGLPSGTYGRIALGVAPSDSRVVYAQIETGPVGTAASAMAAGEEEGATPRGAYDWCNNGAPSSERAGPEASRPALDPARSGVYRSADRGATWTLVSNCDNRPLYFSQVAVDPKDPNTLYLAGSSAAVSHDGGKTFTLLGRAGGLAEPSHVDIHAIWIDPDDSRHVMLGTDGGLNVTWDAGKSWRSVVTMSVGQAYWVSADMRRPYRVVTGMQDNGVWGGPSATRAAEDVILNSAWYGINPGDGFHTAVDPSDYNIVYAESQNGAAMRYNLATGEQKSIRPAAPAAAAGTRAAASAAADGRSCVDGRIVNGVRRGNGRGGLNAIANVRNAQAGEQYRFNWNTPLILSPNSSSIVWLGGNRLFKSYDRGDSWVESTDLTRSIDRCRVSVMGVSGEESQLGKNDGVTFYSTIIAISESPIRPGVVWAGTDDGNLQVSRDGGATFTEVGRNIAGLPAGALSGDDPYWISSVEASHADSATSYVAIDGHRSDDLHPYIFVTHDFGKTFHSVTGDLPESAGDVQVIREDPRNPRVLFAGTEFGLFISLDAGTSWQRAAGGFPTVRTDDILVHPRDGDLIVATHGRGIWIADDITPLQELTPAVQAEDVHLFDVRPAVAYAHDIEADRCRPTLPCLAQAVFAAKNAPRGTAINYYLRSPVTEPVRISITDITGRVVCEASGSGAAGINRIQWTSAGIGPSALRGGGPGAPRSQRSGNACNAEGGVMPAPGSYTVTLTVGNQRYTRVADVLEDRWLDER